MAEKLSEPLIADDELQKAAAVRLHLLVCCIIMFSEGFYATQIFPYVSWMAEDLRGSAHSIGTYTGLLYTASSLGSLSTAYIWARASNHFGRKRCLIVGLSCNICTTLMIAFSTNYWGTVVLRLLSGLLNNNLSIVRTSLRETYAKAKESDTKAFSMLSVAFGASCVAGPSLGGLLYGLGYTPGDEIIQQWSLPMCTCTFLYIVSLSVVLKWLSDDACKVGATGTVASSDGPPPLLLRQGRFLLLLAMGGGHSYVFTGWELGYPLLARLPSDEGGEAWTTAQIGLTFLVGSVGLMSYCFFLYPVLAERIPVLSLWICQWILPVLAMPAFSRALPYLISINARSWIIQAVNYVTQLVVSVLLGSQFVSIQLMLNEHVAQEPNGASLLALANSYLVSTQGLVRAASPMATGSLFTLGRNLGLGVSLPFDHLSVIGLLCGIGCAVLYRRSAPTGMHGAT